MADNTGGIFGGLGWQPLGWDTAAPASANPTVLSQTTTKETDVTVGTEDTSTTKTVTEQTVAGGGIQEWFVRGAVVVLGLIFVAVGLGMFKDEPIGLRFR